MKKRINKTSILLVRLPDRILDMSNSTSEPNENFHCDPKTEFPCNGTETCIPKSWICDGRVSIFLNRYLFSYLSIFNIIISE